MILDVRERDEIKSEGRVEGALNIPLSELEGNLPAIREIGSIKDLQLLCRSGSRAQLAKDKIEKSGPSAFELEVIEGGLKGLGEKQIIMDGAKAGISIMRQVMVIAGLMIAAFSLLGVYQDALFHWASFVIGLALFIAGLSGFCPMAILLGKMPWNK